MSTKKLVYPEDYETDIIRLFSLSENKMAEYKGILRRGYPDTLQSGEILAQYQRAKDAMESLMAKRGPKLYVNRNLIIHPFKTITFEIFENGRSSYNGFFSLTETEKFFYVDELKDTSYSEDKKESKTEDRRERKEYRREKEDPIKKSRKKSRKKSEDPSLDKWNKLMESISLREIQLKKMKITDSSYSALANELANYKMIAARLKKKIEMVEAS